MRNWPRGIRRFGLFSSVIVFIGTILFSFGFHGSFYFSEHWWRILLVIALSILDGAAVFLFFIRLAWVAEGFSDREREGGKTNIVNLVTEWLDLKS